MANISALRRVSKARRHFRVRKRITGTPARPRLVVTRSSRHITAQIVDDTAGHTLASASTLEADLRAAKASGESDKSALARQVGALVAARAKEKGVGAVVF
ncbi:MAG: 50S ribosomal protein L18, partial [Actinomycetota bacterium]|nr:50S ribosomal protein L18 [Actinomycetota bacterium]